MLKNTKHFLSKFSCLLLILGLWESCATKKSEAPIGSDKMQSILIDIHFAEAYSSILDADSIQKKKFNKNMDSLTMFYKEIFDKYGVNAVQFDSALAWYSRHPNLLDSIYVRIGPIMDSLKSAPQAAKKD